MVTSSISSPMRRRSIFSICMTSSLMCTMPGFERLAAAEGEQLVSESAAAFGGAADLFERGALRLLEVAAGQQHVAVAGDDGQQVIEIVRDAAGEPPDRFHLLRLAELLFEASALAAHAGRADFALDGGVQAHQIAAGQVVGGARLQSGRGHRRP